MKTGLKIWLLSGATLGIVASCDNINRDSEDVSARAATLSADSLKTMKLSEVGSLGEEQVAPSTADTDEKVALSANDTVPSSQSGAAAPDASTNKDDNTFTETEVVQVDTIATRIVYDIKRRTIEQVDTVGATKTYEIRKRVLKRTVMLDTLTETEDQEQTVAFQKGDYKVLDEQIKSDSAVEIVDYQKAKQEAAAARTKANTATTTSPTPSKRDSTTTSSSANQKTQPSQSSTRQQTEQSPTQARTNPSTTDTNEKKAPASPGTAKQDTTTRRSDSGS